MPSRLYAFTLLLGILLAPLLVGAESVQAPLEPGPLISEYPQPDSPVAPLRPSNIVVTPDGNVWYSSDLALYRQARNGSVTRFKVSDRNAINDLALGSDGNVWLTVGASHLFRQGAVLKLTPAGEQSSGTSLYGEVTAHSITAGPEGNMWFFTVPVYPGSVFLIRSTTTGVKTEFPLPPNIRPGTMTAGSDGNLWFVDPQGNQIVRSTPTGKFTAFPAPTPNAGLVSIVNGPDGNVWFTESQGNRIGRITPNGVITEFPLPTPGQQPSVITAGPDGNLWFTERASKAIGRITTAGVITEYALPTLKGNPDSIATGIAGELWFTMVDAQTIGRLIVPGRGILLPLMQAQ